MEFISAGIFGKYSKIKILGLIFIAKGKICKPFVGLAPLKLKFLSKEIKGGYVYIEESFDTIFNMGYGSGKSPMGERVNNQTNTSPPSPMVTLW